MQDDSYINSLSMELRAELEARNQDALRDLDRQIDLLTSDGLVPAAESGRRGNTFEVSSFGFDDFDISPPSNANLDITSGSFSGHRYSKRASPTKAQTHIRDTSGGPTSWGMDHSNFSFGQDPQVERSHGGLVPTVELEGRRISGLEDQSAIGGAGGGGPDGFSLSFDIPSPFGSPKLGAEGHGSTEFPTRENDDGDELHNKYESLMNRNADSFLGRERRITALLDERKAPSPVNHPNITGAAEQNDSSLPGSHSFAFPTHRPVFDHSRSKERSSGSSGTPNSPPVGPPHDQIPLSQSNLRLDDRVEEINNIRIRSPSPEPDAGDRRDGDRLLKANAFLGRAGPAFAEMAGSPPHADHLSDHDSVPARSRRISDISSSRRASVPTIGSARRPSHESNSSTHARPCSVQEDVLDEAASSFDFANPEKSAEFSTNVKLSPTICSRERRGIETQTSIDETSGRGMISVLRILQEKVESLQQDKAAAKEKIANLEEEVSKVRQMLFYQQNRMSVENRGSIEKGEARRSREDAGVVDDAEKRTVEEDEDDMLERLREYHAGISESQFSGLVLIGRPPGMENRLHSLRTHSELLERQLDYSRNAARNVEDERNEALKGLEEARREVDELRRKLDLDNTDAERGEDEMRAGNPQKGTNDEAGGDRCADSVYNKSGENSIRGLPGHRSLEPSPSTESDAQPARKFPTPLEGSGLQETTSSADESFLMKDEIDRLRREIESERVGQQDSETPRNMPADKQAHLMRLLRDKTKRKNQGKTDSNVRETAESYNNQVSLPTNPAPSEQPTWKKVDAARPKSSRSESIPVQRRMVGTEDTRSDKFRRSEMSPGSVSSGSSCFHAAREVDDVQGLSLGREMPFIVGKAEKAESKESYWKRSMTKNFEPVIATKSGGSARSASRGRSGNSGDSGHRMQGQRDSRSSVASPQALNEDVDDADHASHHVEIAAGGSENLRQVLTVLEGEFDELKKHYHDLVEQYERMADDAGRGRLQAKGGDSKQLRAIGDQLRDVIRDMETKRDQIAILREILTSSVVHDRFAHSRRARRTDASQTSAWGTQSASDTRKHRPAQRSKSITRSGIKPRRGAAISPGPYYERHGRPAWAASVSGSAGSPERRSGLRLTRPCQQHRAEVQAKEEAAAKARVRSRSRSPGRAMASLSLLKSSLKVQEALKEAVV
ncbi:hypothetical protein HK104_009240 [Borealophlyctis nickersoniae]|nr:hypothetical protein HK104_009240 [Borealophlyctis nickersoniae]